MSCEACERRARYMSADPEMYRGEDSRCVAHRELARAQGEPGRPHKLTWSGTEWTAPCGCHYHPDDDKGTHGGAPPCVHPCSVHASATSRTAAILVPNAAGYWLRASDEAGEWRMAVWVDYVDGVLHAHSTRGTVLRAPFGDSMPVRDDGWWRGRLYTQAELDEAVGQTVAREQVEADRAIAGTNLENADLRSRLTATEDILHKWDHFAADAVGLAQMHVGTGVAALVSLSAHVASLAAACDEDTVADLRAQIDVASRYLVDEGYIDIAMPVERVVDRCRSLKSAEQSYYQTCAQAQRDLAAALQRAERAAARLAEVERLRAERDELNVVVSVVNAAQRLEIEEPVADRSAEVERLREALAAIACDAAEGNAPVVQNSDGVDWVRTSWLHNRIAEALASKSR